MSTIIKPTVGRQVWYRPDPLNKSVNVSVDAQPLAATIVRVIDDRTICIAGFDAVGYTYRKLSVRLRQDGDPVPDGDYCEWMPFQRGQTTASDAVVQRLETLEKRLGA